MESNQAQPTLLQVSSVFPFDLFPDTITVHPDRIIIVHRFFFVTKNIFPIFIKDIKTVVVSQSIIFSCIEIDIKGFEHNPPKVCFLTQYDAQQLHQLIIKLMKEKIEDRNE